MARAQDIPLDKGIAHAALALREYQHADRHRTALVDRRSTDAKGTVHCDLDPDPACCHEVHWPTLSKGKPDGAWLYFYEDFLEVYDNALSRPAVIHPPRWCRPWST